MHGTKRLKALWGPGLGAVALSLLSLHFLPRLFPLGGLVFPHGYRIHYPSFLSLVAIGGLAAYSSRRLGGRVAHRVAACLLPVFCEMLRTFIWWPLTAHLPSVPHLLFLSLTRVVIPSVALLLGAAAFLRDSSARNAPA